DPEAGLASLCRAHPAGRADQIAWIQPQEPLVLTLAEHVPLGDELDPTCAILQLPESHPALAPPHHEPAGHRHGPGPAVQGTIQKLERLSRRVRAVEVGCVRIDPFGNQALELLAPVTQRRRQVDRRLLVCHVADKGTVARPKGARPLCFTGCAAYAPPSP